MCFQLDVPTDSDGDGLLDDWELNGYDADNDGSPELDLPAWGARVDHKDLFLELDWAPGRRPTRNAIQTIKAAFAAAPVNAGSRAGERQSGDSSTVGRPGLSAPDNPDGTRGITLHVDTGAAIDTTARRTSTPGTCADGVDNGGGDGADVNDTDCVGDLRYLEYTEEDPTGPLCAAGVDDANSNCLIGDNLGGGGELDAAPGACGLDAAFYRAKGGNFETDVRRHVFRYAILAAFPGRPPCAGTAGTTTGGQGEIGGNDFIVFNNPADAGTIMHELGHTLNLRHGGVTHDNCKPNFVSVMNYDLQFGIPRVGGGQILDYSPPRTLLNGGHRGKAPLDQLAEDALDENKELDTSDPRNRFVFVNKKGAKVTSDLSGQVNWDGDTDPPYESSTVTANIDTASPAPNPAPGACVNTTTDSTLDGADDWSFVSLPFRQFGDSDDAGIGVETEDVPTTQDLRDMRARINTTDLGITVSDESDPVAAGTDVTFTLTVSNAGFNPANSVRVIDTLPDGVSYLDSSASCGASGQTVTCLLGEMYPGTRKSFTVRARVAADLVYDNGSPLVVTNRAEVSNLAGPDSQPANNKATETTKIVAVADLTVTGSEAVAPPDQILIGQTLPVTLRTTVTNRGPSSPMDATVVTAATAASGSSVTPKSATTTITALAVGAARTVDSTFEIRCDRPGSHSYRFASTIVPARVEDTDPDASNNQSEITITVDCVVPVAINIKPGSNPNTVKVPNGGAAVAVLTTEAGEYGLPLAFDATTIEALSARFGPRSSVFAGDGGATEVHREGHLEDSVERGDVERVRDGDLDMVLHFNAGQTGLTESDTEGCVKGSFTDQATGEEYRFFGCDVVRVIG